MNRESKRKSYQKGYYKTHACDEIFTCKFCGRKVVPTGAGSAHRNHCPNCLCSVHLDIDPGDRAADCGGLMEPIAVWVRKKRRMGSDTSLPNLRDAQLHRIAADDNPMKLMSLAMKPVSFPPFPLEKLEEMTSMMGGDGELKF